jgi:hypothetical protein
MTAPGEGTSNDRDTACSSIASHSSTGHEKATPQETCPIAADDYGTGARLLGDGRLPKSTDSARQVLASRVLPDGDRKDVGRYTISGLAFSIPAGSRLDCRSGSLAPAGHCERSPLAAQVTQAAH